MKIHHFGFAVVLLLVGVIVVMHPTHVQASSQIALQAFSTHDYQPPRAGLPGRREGAGTR